MTPFTEDTLVQQTTANYLELQLGWQSVYAYNSEVFGTDGTLGRLSDKEVVLTRPLRKKLAELNPNLPGEAYDDAVRQIVTTVSAQTLLATNREKYELIRDGVTVTFRNPKGDRIRKRLRIIDFTEPTKNDFLCVRELWVRGELYRRRVDLMGFINGLPLLFMELKNINRDVRAAYEKNFKDYKDTVPQLFYHNAFIILANGADAKLGSISSRFEHFHEWKRLDEGQPGVVDMETLLKGICEKRNFIDLFENFILFDDSSGETRKIIARNHQFLGVNRAIEAVKDRQNRAGRLGVFWHTQGAGKSYSIVLFTKKIHRKLGGNFTFVVLTDRDDLDTQIYKTFAGCGVVDNDRDPCRATSGVQLSEMLAEHKSYVFSLIQKFNQDVRDDAYTQRDDVIVITDEAHRTQYGTLALNMRNALPNASYIGFTGTPLFKDDEITRRVFGEYVSTYDFQRAVEDKATVPLYYDARGDRLGIAVGDINERIASKLEQIESEDIDVAQRLEKELKRDYHVITADKRLDQVAKDFVHHYSQAWQTGKAMLVCIDKITCVRMYNLITHYWNQRIAELMVQLNEATDDQDGSYRRRQLLWMRETRALVVVSEEQGEVEKFRKWGLDIIPHRKLIKEGIELPEAMRQKPQFRNLQRMDLDEAFKEDEHPFRIAIVCAMWLTGFDVPSLSTLYLDKPLKAHTLMQAIARANRVNEGKNNGLVVDYCGILKNLRKALATFAGFVDSGRNGQSGEINPARPEQELVADLVEAIHMVRTFLADRNASLDDIITRAGFERNAAIRKAKEAANENDETRKRFEIISREVFKKFKASINADGINALRSEYDAINVIYKSLQKDTDRADISDIIQELHKVVDDAIQTQVGRVTEESEAYDISRIDFDRLRQEFARSPQRNTTVQNMRQAIERRLQRLLERNPLRTDFQTHYEQIVEEYNREKDRVTIERTFELLLRFVQQMDQEASRAVREGLDEESLALFDLLNKPNLSKKDIERIKKVAVELLRTLKSEKLKVDNWREKETTRDAVRVVIKDYLWNDQIGLPVDAYSEEEVMNMSEEVFKHVYRAYPTVPSPFYEEHVA